MSIKAGHCTACGTLVWRMAVAAKDWGQTKAGSEHLLWPMPESVYAVYQRPAECVSTGIAYCRACAPPVGTDGVFGVGQPIMGYETALTRYEAWYAPERRTFYEAWLADQLFLEPAEIQALLEQWEHDREPDEVTAHGC